jgi:hypothetical protein
MQDKDASKRIAAAAVPSAATVAATDAAATAETSDKPDTTETVRCLQFDYCSV